MSNNSASPSPSPDAGHEAAPLDWFLALLREAIAGVMADDQPTLKKANALARLGSLYLKTYNTAELAHANAELERVNAELEERVAELEERLTAHGGETTAGGEAAAGSAQPEPEGSPTPSRLETANLSKPRSPGKSRPDRRPHGRPAHGRR
jgi:hypothetical protein